MENREARSHYLSPVFAAHTSRVSVGDYGPYQLGEWMFEAKDQVGSVGKKDRAKRYFSFLFGKAWFWYQPRPRPNMPTF